MSLCFYAQKKHLIHPDFLQKDIAPCFDLDYLRRRRSIIGVPSGGRGQAYFFSYHGNEYVLRHYCRGGMMAKVSNDQFVYLGTNRSRSFREFQLHCKLYDAGLPVAKPVGVQISVCGLWYRANYISQKIQNSQTLYELLQTRPSTNIWQALKTTINQFHQFGLDHNDLNCHNILISRKKIYLIDFDKCTLDGNAKTAKKNKQRLLRSLRKELPNLDINLDF